MSSKKNPVASDKEELLRLIEERKKEIDALKKLSKRLSSLTNSFIKLNSK